MGGIGSGRGYQGGKDTTNNYHALDVRQLQRDGLLKPGQVFSWDWSRNGTKVASIDIRTEADRVILDYRYKNRYVGGEGKSENYPVRIEWTPCNYGGARPWFLCPAQGCGRRVAILYLGSAIFACRHCYRLAYACQRETADDRAMRRVDRIRERLGWEPGILNGHGIQPKGMHWRTFFRLIIEHEALVDKWMAGITKRLGLGIEI